jgi:hypothetical protein
LPDRSFSRIIVTRNTPTLQTDHIFVRHLVSSSLLLRVTDDQQMDWEGIGLPRAVNMPLTMSHAVVAVALPRASPCEWGISSTALSTCWMPKEMWPGIEISFRAPEA